MTSSSTTTGPTTRTDLATATSCTTTMEISTYTHDSSGGGGPCLMPALGEVLGRDRHLRPHGEDLAEGLEGREVKRADRVGPGGRVLNGGEAKVDQRHLHCGSESRPDGTRWTAPRRPTRRGAPRGHSVRCRFDDDGRRVDRHEHRALSFTCRVGGPGSMPRGALKRCSRRAWRWRSTMPRAEG
jgi:hypothetical protein